MFSQQNTSTQTAKTKTDALVITLDPLLSDGTAALKPDPENGIARATLREVELQWQDTHQETIVYRADNLFSSSSPAWTKSLSPSVTLARATFDVLFENYDRPHTVSLSPPNIITFEFPADSARLLPWLELRHFRRLAQTLAAILLVLTAALAPPLDDDDQDNDGDDDSNHYTCRA